MAVADLYEAEVASEVADLLAHDVAQSERLQNAALQHAKSARARPSHALQEAATVDAVLIQIFLDVFRHDLILLLWQACVRDAFAALSWEMTGRSYKIFPGEGQNRRWE